MSAEELAAQIVGQQLGKLQTQIQAQMVDFQAQLQAQYEGQIGQLQAKVNDLHDQLQNQPPLPAPVPIVLPAPAAPPKPPKVTQPTAFEGLSDDLDRFKAECSLYLSMRRGEFHDDRSRVLFILSYMKGGMAGPWVTLKTNAMLDPLYPASPPLVDFLAELDKVFGDPNKEATARQKLANIRQGDGSVEDVIRQFEIHGPRSRLNRPALIDRFETAIHPRLCESVYRSSEMPQTWEDWKSRASLLDNQWRRFQSLQSKASPAKTATPSCPATAQTAQPAYPSPRPNVPSTSTSSSTTGSGPQPMELDRARQTRRDPRSGLCFNCGRPGHIAKACPEPRSQRIRYTQADTSPHMSSDEFQALVETVRAAIIPKDPPTSDVTPEADEKSTDPDF